MVWLFNGCVFSTSQQSRMLLAEVVIVEPLVAVSLPLPSLFRLAVGQRMALDLLPPSSFNGLPLHGYQLSFSSEFRWARVRFHWQALLQAFT